MRLQTLRAAIDELEAELALAGDRVRVAPADLTQLLRRSTHFRGPTTSNVDEDGSLPVRSPSALSR